MASLQSNMQALRGRPYYRSLYFLTPMLLTALSLFPSLHNTFTNWDDGEYVSGNSLIRSLSFHHILRLFSPESTVSGNYQPLTILSLAINYACGKLNPTGYIAANVMLHLLNVLLVFIFIRKISRSDRIASLSALLFGVHPMHVESVAWVTGRKDVLYALFYLSALAGYVRYLEVKGRERILPYCLVFLFFVLSLLSKSAAVTLPALLFLLDFYLARAFSSRLILEKLPFLALSVIFGWLAITGQASGGSLGRSYALSMPDRLCITSYSYLFYIVKFFIPIKLSAFYPYPHSLPSSLPAAFKLSPLFAAFTAGSAYYCRRSRAFLFGFFFFLITVIFILHFVPVGATVTADRFTYIPYIGLSFIVAYYCEKLLTMCHRTKPVSAVLAAAGICVIAILCYGAHERCKAWKDSITLWSDVIGQFPSSIPYNYRGLAYYANGDYAGAITNFNLAVACNPGYADAHFNRALAYYAAGDYIKAIDGYTGALTCNPGYYQAYDGRGRAYYATGDYAHAVADYTRAAAYNPAYAKAYYNRGIVYAALGNFGRALQDYSRAVSIDPDFADAYYNGGQACLALNDLDNAIRYYSHAIGCDSGRVGAYNSRGIAYCLKGDNDRAIADYDRAIARDPAYLLSYVNRGNALMAQGNYDRAIRDFSTAIAHDPVHYAQAYYNRGLAWATKGDRERAGEDFTRACDMKLAAACRALEESGLPASQRRSFF